MTQDARTADFFGEGTLDPNAVGRPKRDWSLNPPRTNLELSQMRVEMGLEPLPFDYVETRSPQERAQQAYERGNIGGAGGAYNAGTDSARAWWDANYMTNQGGFSSSKFAEHVDLNPFNNRMLPPHQRAEMDHAKRWAQQPSGNPETYVAQPGAGIDVPQNPNGPPPDPSLPHAYPDPPGTGGGGAGGGGGTGGAGGGATPTHVRNEEVDAALAGLGKYEQAFWELSQDNTGLSVAEAQLRRATEMANFQAAREAERSQRAAFGAASGARNRADRALLERQAIGQSGYIGQQSAIEAAENNRRMRLDMSVLRAGEEQADKAFKLEALKEAANLGLNVAALEVDMSKVDVAAAADIMRIELGWAQLDQQKAKDMLDFTRDMAIIQQNYDRMSLDAQIETERLLMQKYGIDQQTMVALKEIKERHKFRWEGLLTAFVGGAGQGAGSAIGKGIVG